MSTVFPIILVHSYDLERAIETEVHHCTQILNNTDYVRVNQVLNFHVIYRPRFGYIIETLDHCFSLLFNQSKRLDEHNHCHDIFTGHVESTGNEAYSSVVFVSFSFCNVFALM